MSDAHKVTDDSQSSKVKATERSSRPADYVATADIDPEAAQEKLNDLLNEFGTRNGSEWINGFRIELQVRGTRQLGDASDSPIGWSVYQCDLTGSKFSVPEEAPVPVIIMEHEGDDYGDWCSVKVLHPDLLYDYPKLVDQLVAQLRYEVVDHLRKAFDAAKALQALSDTEELPSAGNPYPVSDNGRAGYEALGDRRPRCTE